MALTLEKMQIQLELALKNLGGVLVKQIESLRTQGLLSQQTFSQLPQMKQLVVEAQQKLEASIKLTEAEKEQATEKTNLEKYALQSAIVANSVAAHTEYLSLLHKLELFLEKKMQAGADDTDESEIPEDTFKDEKEAQEALEKYGKLIEERQAQLEELNKDLTKMVSEQAESPPAAAELDAAATAEKAAKREEEFAGVFTSLTDESFGAALRESFKDKDAPFAQVAGLEGLPLPSSSLAAFNPVMYKAQEAFVSQADAAKKALTDISKKLSEQSGPISVLDAAVLRAALGHPLAVAAAGLGVTRELLVMLDKGFPDLEIIRPLLTMAIQAGVLQLPLAQEAYAQLLKVSEMVKEAGGALTQDQAYAAAMKLKAAALVTPQSAALAAQEKDLLQFALTGDPAILKRIMQQDPVQYAKEAVLAAQTKLFEGGADLSAPDLEFLSQTIKENQWVLDEDERAQNRFLCAEVDRVVDGGASVSLVERESIAALAGSLVNAAERAAQLSLARTELNLSLRAFTLASVMTPEKFAEESEKILDNVHAIRPELRERVEAFANKLMKVGNDPSDTVRQQLQKDADSILRENGRLNASAHIEKVLNLLDAGKFEKADLMSFIDVPPLETVPESIAQEEGFTDADIDQLLQEDVNASRSSPRIVSPETVAEMRKEIRREFEQDASVELPRAPEKVVDDSEILTSSQQLGRALEGLSVASQLEPKEFKAHLDKLKENLVVAPDGLQADFKKLLELSEKASSAVGDKKEELLKKVEASADSIVKRPFNEQIDLTLKSLAKGDFKKEGLVELSEKLYNNISAAQPKDAEQLTQFAHLLKARGEQAGELTDENKESIKKFATALTNDRNEEKSALEKEGSSLSKDLGNAAWDAAKLAAGTDDLKAMADMNRNFVPRLNVDMNEMMLVDVQQDGSGLVNKKKLSGMIEGFKEGRAQRSEKELNAAVATLSSASALEPAEFDKQLETIEKHLPKAQQEMKSDLNDLLKLGKEIQGQGKEEEASKEKLFEKLESKATSIVEDIAKKEVNKLVDSSLEDFSKGDFKQEDLVNSSEALQKRVDATSPKDAENLTKFCDALKLAGEEKDPVKYAEQKEDIQTLAKALVTDRATDKAQAKLESGGTPDKTEKESPKKEKDAGERAWEGGAKLLKNDGMKELVAMNKLNTSVKAKVDIIALMNEVVQEGGQGVLKQGLAAKKTWEKRKGTLEDLKEAYDKGKAQAAEKNSAKEKKDELAEESTGLDKKPELKPEPSGKTAAEEKKKKEEEEKQKQQDDKREKDQKKEEDDKKKKKADSNDKGLKSPAEEAEADKRAGQREQAENHSVEAKIETQKDRLESMANTGPKEGVADQAASKAGIVSGGEGGGGEEAKENEGENAPKGPKPAGPKPSGGPSGPGV